MSAVVERYSAPATPEPASWIRRSSPSGWRSCSADRGNGYALTHTWSTANQKVLCHEAWADQLPS